MPRIPRGPVAPIHDIALSELMWGTQGSLYDRSNKVIANEHLSFDPSV